MKNNIDKSLECFYEEDMDAAESMLNTLILSHPDENFEQFKRDCGYYYSKLLNHPFVPPSVLQFDFMRRCQLQCKICKIWSRQATKQEEELTYEELKVLFDQAAELGVSQCYFSGGEPFMLPYLFEILKYSTQKGMKAEVTTNGLLLNKENCRKIINLGLHEINISIDGASAKTHDYHRNKPGLFDAVMGNLKQLIALKKLYSIRRARRLTRPVIVMACVLTNKNFHEMLEYVKLARRLGVMAFFQPYTSENDNYYNRSIEDEFVIPKERLPLLFQEIDRVIEYKMSFKDHEFISNTVDSFQSLKQYFSNSLEPAKHCFAGFNRIIILDSHKVNICPEKLGDFSKNTLREIWFSQHAQEARKLTYSCSKPCLMGSAYFPGPTSNDIFLIVKRYLLYLEKNNLYNQDSINQAKEQLMFYKSILLEKGLSQEVGNLELIFEYLKNKPGMNTPDRGARRSRAILNLFPFISKLARRVF